MSGLTGMKPDPWFLVARLLPVTEKEARHLGITADRLRAAQPNLDWVRSLESNVEGAEMLDAFVSRFSRLQDTLGDKLVPAMLRASLEPSGTQLDNLLRAEKLGWISSAERWIELRMPRNRLVHEYMDSPDDLLQAVHGAQDGVEFLISTQRRIAADAHRLMNLAEHESHRNGDVGKIGV